MPLPINVTQRKLRRLWVSGTLAYISLVDVTYADRKSLPTTFDTGILERLGIASETARYLSLTAKFSPGRRRVEVVVNGLRRGITEVEFDHEGTLLFHQAFLEHAGLNSPSAPAREPYDFLATYPRTQVQLHPGKDEVSLITSQEALKPKSNGMNTFQRGGTAALLNYNLFGSTNRFGDHHSRYLSSNTELGINIDNWIARSRQTLVSINGNPTFQPLYSYVQKNLGDDNLTLQAGQITASNSVFPGAPITGVQLTPESALQSRSAGITINGIANSQARVEVRQSGALIYTTIVAPGAFSLNDIVPVSGVTRFDVEVFESDGHLQQFSVQNIVPAVRSQKPLSYSIAAGRLYNFGLPSTAKPLLVNGVIDWAFNRKALLSSGAMLSDNHYKAAGLSFDAQLTPMAQVNIRNIVSRSQQVPTTGNQTNLSLSTRLRDSLSLSTYSTLQSSAFRPFEDRLAADTYSPPHAHRLLQYGFAVGWTNPVLGNFTATTSTSSASHSRNTLLSATWNKAFKYASTSFNIQQLASTSPQDIAPRKTTSRTSAAFRIDIPFGRQYTTSTYINYSDNSARYGTAVDGRYNDQLSYRLNVEQNSHNHKNAVAGSLNKVSGSNQARLGYSQSDSGNLAWNGQLQGGIALHDKGITASPYHLRDTFAVATVSGLPNVKLTTPSGPIWTDSSGTALVANLQPYQPARVDIFTPSLPRNTDVTNASKTLSPSRGSVLKVDYPVITSRRVLLHVSYSDSSKPAKGAAVFDAEDRFLTTVIDGGKIYLSDAQPNSPLRIEDMTRTPCLVTPRLPTVPNHDAYFETLEAVCEPLQA